MNVEIIKYPTEEDWLLVKRCTLVTVGKESNKPATEKFKRDMLRARHSPIRELKFVFYLTDIPYWVSVHLCRHVHAQPYVRTQRNDRQTAYDRESAPQNAPVDMMWSVNGEELITIANKRLCNLASQKTRELVRMICREVIKLCPEFKEELVPMCVRNGGVCYEMFPCGEMKGNERKADCLLSLGVTVQELALPKEDYYVLRNTETGMYFRGKGVNRWGKYFNQATIYRVKGTAEHSIKEVAWHGEKAELVHIKIVEMPQPPKGE